MTRGLWLALAALVVLAALAIRDLRLESDARGLLGPGDRIAEALDAPQGRTLTLAVIDPDPARRSMIAKEVAASARSSPLVSQLHLAPEAPSPALLDWLWRHRFVLAPPGPADFRAESMAAEMSRARAALTTALGGALADRFLLDPTGSFRRLVEALSDGHRQGLTVEHGVFQSRDGAAALVFVVLADRPFDVESQRRFDAELRASIEARGGEALLIGPRSVSARVSEQIAGRSKTVAIVAGALVLLWLAAVLRSARLVLLCLLPLGIGLSLGVLAVGFAFGGVHVVALGFGGALVGLAMDYPVHLLGHGSSGAHRRRARRNVLAGAATTAIAFLALLGSGIPALMQTGVFVACGLLAAAACSVALVSRAPRTALDLAPPLRGPLETRWKSALLLAAGLAAGGMLSLTWGDASQRLVEVPAPIVRDIQRMDGLVDLPSGRYRIDVSAETLGTVLERQARLRAPLDAAARDGAFSRADMLAARLPARPAEPAFAGSAAFSGAVSEALADAGLAASFREEIVAAYEAARDVPPLGPRDLAPVLGFAPVAQLIRVEEGLLHAPVRLWDVTDPARIASAAEEAGAGVAFVDEEAAISAALGALRGDVTGWVALGAAGGFLFLFILLRPARAVAELAGSCLVAGLLSMALAGFVAGGVSVFHVAAFALVIGIGIDYGLFLTLSMNRQDFTAAIRTVFVCATTTLIAFLAMALSRVTVLEHIGTVVSAGVVLMVAVHLLRRPRGIEARGPATRGPEDHK